MYLVVDLNSDWKGKASYKDLKELLITLLQDDLLCNHKEYDIVKKCSSDLVKMALEEKSFKWIEEQLSSYSYKIINLLDLQRDLEDVKVYFLDNDCNIENICETIDEINEVVNKNG